MNAWFLHRINATTRVNAKATIDLLWTMLSEEFVLLLFDAVYWPVAPLTNMV